MTAAALRRSSKPAADRRPAPARWMVYGFCPLTGPWREIVRAATAAGALVRYCAEHDMSPEACHVRPH
jgi:hypothetical protein